VQNSFLLTLQKRSNPNALYVSFSIKPYPHDPAKAFESERTLFELLSCL